MTSRIERLIQVVTVSPLSDVSVAGVITRSRTGWRFRHNLMSVYLHFDDGTVLSCTDIDQYDKLALTFVEGVQFDFDLLEGEAYATASIAELCLKMPGSALYIESMTFVTSGAATPMSGVVKCAGFSLQGGDFLFLDPTHLFGIQIADCQAYEAWLQIFGGREDPLTEWVWRRGDSAFQALHTL